MLSMLLDQSFSSLSDTTMQVIHSQSQVGWRRTDTLGQTVARGPASVLYRCKENDFYIYEVDQRHEKDTVKLSQEYKCVGFIHMAAFFISLNALKTEEHV